MGDSGGAGGRRGKKNKYGTYSSEEAQKKKKQRDKSKEILDTLFTTVCALHPTARSHDPQRHNGRFNSALLDTIDLLKAYTEARPISQPRNPIPPKVKALTFSLSDSEMRQSLMESETYGLIHVCVDDWRILATSKALLNYCPFLYFSQYVGQNLTCLSHIDDHEMLQSLKEQSLAYLSPAATPPARLQFPLRLLRMCEEKELGMQIACFCEQQVQVLHVGRDSSTGRAHVLLGFAPAKEDLEPLTVGPDFWSDWDARTAECIGSCRITHMEPRTGLVDLRAWTASRGMKGIQSPAGDLFSTISNWTLSETTQNSLRESVNDLMKNNAVYHWFLTRARGGIMRVQVCCHMSIEGIVQSDWVPAVTYDMGSAAIRKAGKKIGSVGELHQFAAVLVGDPKRADSSSSKGILSFYALKSAETGMYHTQMYLAHVFKIPERDDPRPTDHSQADPFSRAASTASQRGPGSPHFFSRNISPCAPNRHNQHSSAESSHQGAYPNADSPTDASTPLHFPNGKAAGMGENRRPHILSHLACAGLRPIKLHFTKTQAVDNELVDRFFWTAEGIQFPWVVGDV